MHQKRMALKIGVFVGVVAALVVALGSVAGANGPTVPSGFNVTSLASGLSGPKGIVSAHFQAGNSAFGRDLYVAESGANHIRQVSKTGGSVLFASGTLNFPVGVAFGPESLFGTYLYVGNAFGGGVSKVDSSGTVSAFAAAGQNIAGLDFGRGAGFGRDLYAAEWTAGQILRIGPGGGAGTLFATMPALMESRYLKFSQAHGFGHYLYVSGINGNINRIDTAGNVGLFVNLGVSGLEGFDFSLGGAWGHYLYAGNVSTGDIYQIAPDGTFTVWASGFASVADIHFEPSGKGGFTMYVVDATNGQVYAIHR